MTLAAAAAKSLQSCPTLCDPRDGSPPGSSVPGILQARTLEWVAISFSSAWTWKVKVKSLSHVQLLATRRTVAYQAPLSMGFSRQQYWSGVPLPSPQWHWTTLQKSNSAPPSNEIEKHDGIKDRRRKEPITQLLLYDVPGIVRVPLQILFLQSYDALENRHYHCINTRRCP